MRASPTPPQPGAQLRGVVGGGGDVPRAVAYARPSCRARRGGRSAARGWRSSSDARRAWSLHAAVRVDLVVRARRHERRAEGRCRAPARSCACHQAPRRELHHLHLGAGGALHVVDDDAQVDGDDKGRSSSVKRRYGAVACSSASLMSPSGGFSAAATAASSAACATPAPSPSAPPCTRRFSRVRAFVSSRSASCAMKSRDGFGKVTPWVLLASPAHAVKGVEQLREEVDAGVAG